MTTILRDWFLPDDGIRREVISADIQSFLGNDATVKGYWIRAYRNLTSSMIADLKYKSSKWDQESKKTGKRGSNVVAVGKQDSPDPLPVNYEDSKTFRDQQGGRYDTGKHSPKVEVPYHTGVPPRHAINPDSMDYEPTRPVTRPDPHSRTHMANTGAVVGSYGEPMGYPPSRSAPPPGYIMQGNEYVPDPGYHAPRLAPPDRNSPQHAPGYLGHVPQHSRDVDMMDTRYAPRDDARDLRDPRDSRDPRYALPREDSRYSHSREDVRYSQPREDTRYPEDVRHRSQRDDPRYGQPPPHVGREDPRYPPPPARDSRDYHRDRDEARYPPPMPREDPRVPVGYAEPPHPIGYAQQPVFDQYGRPVAYPANMQPVEQVYVPPPPSSSSRLEAPYSNSGRKRGAPPEEASRHGHRHGRH